MSERFAFIAAEKADDDSPYPVTKMCAWLQVTTSGFYAYEKAAETDRDRRRAKVTQAVQHAYAGGRGAYGVRRVHAALTRGADPQIASASVKLVRSIMRELGLAGRQKRAYKATTTPDPAAAAPADQLGRDFTATAPGTKLVGDITFVRTMTGWLYLATVIDCATRQVIGWSMATHMRASLVCDAITMAAGRTTIQPGAVFHSDRGRQYTSQEFRDHLEKHNITGSMGRVGQCWDNALAESFFGALKTELVYQTAFPTPEKARQAIAEYIEVFYNRDRLHSALDYKTPDEVAHIFNQITDKAA